MNKSYKYDWECVEPESLKEQQSGFWASFILADCWPHGWGNWAHRSSGCCERNTELCIRGGRGSWLLALIPPPPSLPPVFSLLTNRWRFSDEVSQWGLPFRLGVMETRRGVHLFSIVSAPFHWLGRNVCLIQQGRGQVGKVLSVLTKMYAGVMHWWHICASELDKGWVLERAALILSDEDHLLPHLPWAMGSGGHRCSCSASP